MRFRMAMNIFGYVRIFLVTHNSTLFFNPTIELGKLLLRMFNSTITVAITVTGCAGKAHDCTGTPKNEK